MDATPWATAWRTLLHADGERSARAIAQGRAYHRSGRVTDLQVTTGRLSGRVQGRRATPRAVEVTITALGEDDWATIVELLAGQLRHSARLLAGLQPAGLTEQLLQQGVRLLPEPHEVESTCGCGGAQPCAHTAAVWERTTERIAENPFTLLRLRGRGRERLLADLASARTQHTGGAGSVPLSELRTTAWTSARSPLEDLHLPTADARDAVAGTLRVLGDPPGWPRGPSAAELFGPLVARAARWAADLDRDR